MLQSLSENLNMLMARKRLSSSELARQIGIPATTIKRIRNNEHTNPTIATLLPIADYFLISLNQLIGSDPIKFNEGKYPDKLYKIPLLTWGECFHYMSLDYKKIYKQVYTERRVGEKAFSLINEDYDVVFPKGSVLIIDPEKMPTTGDYVIVGNIKQEIATVRKYLIEIDQIYLKPLVEGIDISIMTPAYKILGIIIQYKVDLIL